jgi:beta-glucosidase
MSSKVEELLSKMSVEEKVALLMSIPIDRLLDGKEFSEEKAKQYLKHEIDEITRIGGSWIGLSPKEVVRVANQVQRFLVEKARLGIPAIIHEECLADLMAFTAIGYSSCIYVES